MGFLAKGNRIILQPGSGSGTDRIYLYKVINSNGTFNDATWGDIIQPLANPITNSVWSTYSSYKYNVVGFTSQVFADNYTFNRNIRFDSSVRLEELVVPSNTDISNIAYLTAVVRGTTNDDVSTVVGHLIDDFTNGTNDYTLAIGVMNRDIDDLRNNAFNYNTVKTYAGSALSNQDYTLTTAEAIYLVNLALAPNSMFDSITSLSLNVYEEAFIEFLGDNFVAPGSIGKTEMDPNYKAERAINNYIATIDDEHITSDGTIVLDPEYTVQVDTNSIYYLLITGTTTPTGISLGYYDQETSAYISVGTVYPVTVSGTILDKVCVAIITNNQCAIMPLVTAATQEAINQANQETLEENY